MKKWNIQNEAVVEGAQGEDGSLALTIAGLYGFRSCWVFPAQ